MGLQLYDLAGAEPERRFSPYCWRIKLALITVDDNPARGVCASNPGQFVRARRCPVSHPQAMLAARVETIEQHLTVEDRQARRLDAGSRSPADPEQFVGACCCPVSHPQANLAIRIQAFK